MFEISVASKYLLPRRRQLSVSIISLISTLVIALVVWLIVVFFSVTDGLEKSWVHKLTALTAPVRLTPTDAYFNSYYYQIDSISEAGGYGHKTIGEKKNALISDPYNVDYDEEIPAYWPMADRQPDGNLKDIVKLAYQAIDEIKDVPDIKAQDFELTASNINLKLSRETAVPYLHHVHGTTTQSVLSYPAYLGNFEPQNQQFNQTLLPIRASDVNNLFNLLASSNREFQDESIDTHTLLPLFIIQQNLNNFFQSITITQLKTKVSGWRLPSTLFPIEANWKAVFIFKNDRLLKVIIPSSIDHLNFLKAALEAPGTTIKVGDIQIQDKQISWQIENQPFASLPTHVPLLIDKNVEMTAHVIPESIEKAKRPDEVKFAIQLNLQGVLLEGIVPFRGLEIGKVQFHSLSAEHSPLWIHTQIKDDNSLSSILPSDSHQGEGVLLPKSFKDTGVLLGDRGYLTYYMPTTSVILEQHLPIYVAGFYDPGIIPIGGKFILVNRSVTSAIRAAQHQQEKGLSNGINVRFSNIQQAENVKEQLTNAFEKAGISRYWTIETYREYEFTKEIMHELQSQKTLFTLISIVIIVVACSNIISMLIILVNDKKTEIGILRSMGASSKSIALIFGLAGAMIGMVGSLIGIIGAIFTLNHLQFLIELISRLQGHQMFSAHFYGDILPNELSYEALFFVLLATSVISLLAGIVPAVKACLVRPSSILRSTGE